MVKYIQYQNYTKKYKKWRNKIKFDVEFAKKMSKVDKLQTKVGRKFNQEPL